MKTKVVREKCVHCHFLHHSSHMDAWWNDTLQSASSAQFVSLCYLVNVSYHFNNWIRTLYTEILIDLTCTLVDILEYVLKIK
jgi:hypothetical protein